MQARHAQRGRRQALQQAAPGRAICARGTVPLPPQSAAARIASVRDIGALAAAAGVAGRPEGAREGGHLGRRPGRLVPGAARALSLTLLVGGAGAAQPAARGGGLPQDVPPPDRDHHRQLLRVHDGDGAAALHRQGHPAVPGGRVERLPD
ncbi:hypothetical protein ON010_g1658 [Phytophthora cinnamomi]|nr:hypothetical protein ON010_g1658 [Phytophthora cinnamomi]